MVQTINNYFIFFIEGSATVGGDFTTNQLRLNLSFPFDGIPGRLCIALSIRNDNDFEETEEFTVHLFSPANENVSIITVSILDDECKLLFYHLWLIFPPNQE